MPLFKERAPLILELSLVDGNILLFCWIKPKSKSDICSESKRKAMIDVRLLFTWYERTYVPSFYQAFFKNLFLLKEFFIEPDYKSKRIL